MIQEKFTAVEAVISTLKSRDIVRIWNDYCDDCSYADNRVEYMDMFSELWHDSDPLWLLDRVLYGDFRTGDDYYFCNGYGNFVSFSYWDDSDSPICLNDSFISWIIECYDERSEYITEDDIADAFVEYINKELGTNYDLDEIYELADKGEVYNLDTILNDEWEMWLENVKSAK